MAQGNLNAVENMNIPKPAVKYEMIGFRINEL